jgi:toxin-antitoxin system PIN domain toxin
MTRRPSGSPGGAVQLLDVNILVAAHRADSPDHPEVASFLQERVEGERTFGVPEMAFSSLVRIVTQPAFKPPSTTAQAFDFCAAVMRSSRCLVVRPTQNHWTIFEQICRAGPIRGKLVADAYLAAFALDRDDEWVTTDRDFEKFPGLRWRLMPTGQLRTNPR